MAEGLYVCGWVKRGPSGIIGKDVDLLQLVSVQCEIASLRECLKGGKPCRHKSR